MCVSFQVAVIEFRFKGLFNCLKLVSLKVALFKDTVTDEHFQMDNV